MTTSSGACTAKTAHYPEEARRKFRTILLTLILLEFKIRQNACLTIAVRQRRPSGFEKGWAGAAWGMAACRQGTLQPAVWTVCSLQREAGGRCVSRPSRGTDGGQHATLPCPVGEDVWGGGRRAKARTARREAVMSQVLRTRGHSQGNH